MSVPSWPAELPQAMLAMGQTLAPAANTIRSANDTGPAKVRRRSTAGIRPFSGRMPLRPTQKVSLEAFFEETLGGGALPFLFPDPFGGPPLLCRFAENGLSFEFTGSKRLAAALIFEVLP